MKQNGNAVSLVSETKGTHDFLKLRTSEADKVHRRIRHFEILNHMRLKVVVLARTAQRPHHCPITLLIPHGDGTQFCPICSLG